MKRAIAAVAIVAGIVVIYAVTAMYRPGVEIPVVSPSLGTIEAYVEEQAVTQLPRDFLIAMPIDGWLEPIEVREGDEVQAGQVVARLDTADLENRLQQAEARISRLETKIEETDDHRLEQNALEETIKTVEAVDQTVAAAEAKIAAVRAVMDFAASEVERLKSLRESGAANERELREAVTQLRKAEAEYRSDLLELAALRSLSAASHIGPKFIRDYIDRKSFTRDTYARELDEARAERAIVQRNLERAQISSPVDGVVLHRQQTRRQFLPAGTPLLTIGRMEELEVIADVLTERATRISVGDPVEIFGEALLEPIPGRVQRVYPAGFTKISSLGVEQQRVNVVVSLEEHPQRLGVGFRVYVRIRYDHADDALVLPRTALVRSPRAGWEVFVVRDGRLAVQPVKIGLMNDESAQIAEGLDAAALVVARPSKDIEAGMRVTPTTRD
jgi:HlyD family secretion protein